jgi:ubiquinone/menaquinone biosynthesis C-methylase UbiE
MLNSLEPVYHPYRQRLLEGLQGDILEIGAGTGSNCRYFAPGTRFHAVEPNVVMHPFLEREAAVHGLKLHLAPLIAEKLETPDASMDAVVSTLVLCSVKDPLRVLSEVQRVLRPGGRFYFLEHVLAEEGSWMRPLQHAIAPVWRRALGGCHPNRDTVGLLREAGFGSLEITREQILYPLPVASHILGVAVR